MRHLILFISWAAVNIAYGQDSTKHFQVGADLSIGAGNAGNQIFFPGITFSRGKHLLFAGPMLVNGADEAQGGPLLGAQAGYQIYPNGRHRRFCLFFEYDLNFLDARIVHHVAGPTNAANGGLKKRTIDFFTLFNYFSYGFRLNITRGFYFKTSVGVGIGWSRERFIHEYWNGQILDEGPGDLDLGALIKIGLGCDFLAGRRNNSLHLRHSRSFR